ncbi:hypothetical protein CF15_01955 [Pyrodictium occultum]|uniref:(Fe-S)-binding protein n=1 Tax=Pyrodictium occultum TaxID=2309 RepID=A0A0V8RU65_PYROC|nr:(Fe-S)-binding protein [Pyrodictium occultum]KSW11617.1 hypothetical protein CF15_01955 [Pyrodictium occultum]
MIHRDAVDAIIGEAEEIAREALAACTRCMMCAAGCTSYRAVRDPRLAPPRRLEAAARVLLEGRATSDDLVSLYTCSMCGACTLLCPFGIEVWRLVYAARAKLSLQGRAPKSLQQVAENAAVSGHSFVARREEPRRVLERVAKEAGVEPGSPGDVLYVPSPFETTLYPEKLREVLLLLRLLGAKVTVSPEALDLGGNVAFDAARPDVGLALLEKAVEEAEKLGARRVVAITCGADIKFIHLARAYGLVPGGGVEVADGLAMVAGLAPRAGHGNGGRGSMVFTSCGFCRFGYRTVCPLVLRLAGAGQPRDRPPYTLCCGGGGGVNYLKEEPFPGIRERIYRWRVERMLEQGVREIVTPCIKCYTVFLHGAVLAGALGRLRVELLTSRLLEHVRAGAETGPGK